MDEATRRLRADTQRLAQGKARSQVRYPDALRLARDPASRRLDRIEHRELCAGRGAVEW
jgi:hypothetical protein